MTLEVMLVTDHGEKYLWWCNANGENRDKMDIEWTISFMNKLKQQAVHEKRYAENEVYKIPYDERRGPDFEAFHKVVMDEAKDAERRIGAIELAIEALQGMDV